MSGRPALFPNTDPSLRKTSTEFAVDAAKRFPFKADAPSGGDAAGRVAKVGYMAKRVEIINLSGDDWNNVEVWINQEYVVFVPKLAKTKERVTVLPFQMLFNDQGHSFPDANDKQTMVNKVQVYMDGKMYDVHLQLAD